MKVGFIFIDNMRNILIIILLSSYVSFAQSKEDDLKEANRISELFFKEVLYHSCTWDWVSDFKHGVDTLSIRRNSDAIGFYWWFSYKSIFSGETRYEAFLHQMGETIYAKWQNKRERSCLPSKVISSIPNSSRPIQMMDNNEILKILKIAFKRDSIRNSN
jgi:hypothetical protein